MFEVSAEKEETPGLKDGIALTSINGLNTVLLLNAKCQGTGSSTTNNVVSSNSLSHKMYYYVSQAMSSILQTTSS